MQSSWNRKYCHDFEYCPSFAFWLQRNIHDHTAGCNILPQPVQLGNFSSFGNLETCKLDHNCTEILDNHTKPCLVFSHLIPRLLPPALNSFVRWQPLVKLYWHVTHVLWSLWLNFQLFQKSLQVRVPIQIYSF